MSNLEVQKATIKTIIKLYWKTFTGENIPSPTLNSYWEQYTRGKTLEEIKKEIIETPEAIHYRDSTTEDVKKRIEDEANEKLKITIKQFYTELLGREADESGLNHYVLKYKTGMSLIDIHTQISNSKEAKKYRLSLEQPKRRDGQTTSRTPGLQEPGQINYGLYVGIISVGLAIIYLMNK